MNRDQMMMIVLGVLIVAVVAVFSYGMLRRNNVPVAQNSVEDVEDVQENFYTTSVPDVANVPEGVSDFSESYYLLDDGNDRQDLILDNLCSKSCCSPQYPTPFNLVDNKEVCKNKDKYVGSNIFCNNPYQDSGCLCLTRDQAISLSNRGGNARTV